MGGIKIETKEGQKREKVEGATSSSGSEGPN
jgi:hypothetical protein